MNDLTGKKFGRLKVISLESRNPVKWLCRCDCGNETKVTTSHLKSGHTKSCGCLQREETSKASSKSFVGKKIGRLLVLSRQREDGKTYYFCLCDCGKTTKVLGCNLATGNTVSCGCYRSEYVSSKNLKHGKRKTRIYECWLNMKRRCYDERNNRYKWYGGKGIRVCDEWLGDNGFCNFFVWSMENGYNDHLTIDRINSDEGYKPSNCRWITRSENSRLANEKRKRIMKAKESDCIEK